MLNIFSALRSAVFAPINFAVTYTGQLFSKIKSVALPIFNSIGDFFYRGSIVQKRANLEGRASVGNIGQNQPLNERQQLLTILEAWQPNCSEEEKTAVTQEIITCYDQKTTSITIGNSSIESLPDVFALRGFANLKIVRFQSCISLRGLPESIGNLTALTGLDLIGCHSLTTLPVSIGNLTALTRLVLVDSLSLRALPESIGNLTALTYLDLINCPRLTALPERIGNLTALTSLSLQDCHSLTALTKKLGNLTALSDLSLFGCWSLTALPESIGNLTALRSIYLQDCRLLTALPESIGNLRALTELMVGQCASLKGLPNAILSLPRSCRIEITGCIFSQATIESLSTSTRAHGYKGPQIDYVMQCLGQQQLRDH